MNLILPDGLREILQKTPELQRAYLVGGCVRDALLGVPVLDYDIEVYGTNYEHLAQTLSSWGRTDLVGRSFGVIKLTLPESRGGDTFDFTIPRADSKTSPGHKGFDIAFNTSITPREAAARRDFTINSILLDPRTGELLDFYGGANDLNNKILRHTSPAFSEDPLRVLRGMQFAGRFNLRAVPETLQLCHGIQNTYSELAVERVREEWFKWAERSTTPSSGLRFLVETGWIKHYPELESLIGTPQNPEWHPEGDVFTHTCHCCDAMATLPQWKTALAETRIVLMLAILTHDFGKPSTTHTESKNGVLRLVSPGHEEAGAPLAENFLQRIDTPKAIRERVIPLVTNHLFYIQAPTDRAVRRLARRLYPETIEHLTWIMEADSMGRPPRPPAPPTGVNLLLEKARQLQLQASAPHPILKGRHLLECGLKPDKEFSTILNAAFEAQIEGEFADLDGAFLWLERKHQIFKH